MYQPTVPMRGMTLIELLVGIAIASVLITLAVPSMQTFMGRSQISATTNTLVYSLQTARSEAVKQSVPVGVCPSADPLADKASCNAGAGYESGWIVYVDSSLNGNREKDESILVRVEERSNAFVFTPDKTFANQVYFDSAGASSNTVGTPLSGEIAIDYADGAERRRVVISANGRIATELQ